MSEIPDLLRYIIETLARCPFQFPTFCILHTRYVKFSSSSDECDEEKCRLVFMSCSFHFISNCGTGTGELVVTLLSCNRDLSTHLESLGISLKSGFASSRVTEQDVILNRAGFFSENIPGTVDLFTICPKHRLELTTRWSGIKRVTCGHPSHDGQRKKVTNPRRVNLQMSEELFAQFNQCIPIGTGE